MEKVIKYKHITSLFKPKRKSLVLQDNTAIYSATQHQKYIDFEEFEETVQRQPNRGLHLHHSLAEKLKKDKM